MRENLKVLQSDRFVGRLSLFKFYLLLVGALLPLGCNRGVPDSELGDIHYSLPEIPGAEMPTPLPPPDRGELNRSEEAPESEKANPQPETSLADPAAATEQPEEKATSEEAAPAAEEAK